jgi:hypothetical protein
MRPTRGRVEGDGHSFFQKLVRYRSLGGPRSAERLETSDRKEELQKIDRLCSATLLHVEKDCIVTPYPERKISRSRDIASPVE